MQNNTSLGKATSIWMDTTESTDYPSLSGNISTDVAIVGGGIAGLMTAYFLKKAGFAVAVLESNKIAAGTTGFTTAKVTSAHGLIYKYLIDKFGSKKAGIYALANQTAIEKVAEIISEEKIKCDFKRMPAYTYAMTADQLSEIKEEIEAAKSLGLPVSFSKNLPLPFTTFGAITYDNQAQFHPRKYLLAIASLIHGEGSTICEGTNVLDVYEGDICKVITDKGTVTARQVIIVTNYPVFDPTGFFAQLTARQSLVVGVRLDQRPPQGMFYGTSEKDFHSLRPQVWRDNEEILLSGGGLEKTGEKSDIDKRYELLAKWTEANFPVKSIEYHWTTSDSESPDRVPMIGPISPTSKNVFVATGFSGWGMTHGHVAGMILCDELRRKHHPWSELYSPNRFSSFLSTKSAKENIKPITTKDKLEGDKMSFDDVEKGMSKVIEINGKKVAVSKDEEGNVQAVSAVCTHMGCTVSWNNTAKTWDCPCHGSRYDRFGKVIHGPAVKDLEKLEESA